MGRMFFHEKVMHSFYHIDFYLDRRLDKKKTILLYVLTLAIFIGLLSSIFNVRDFYNGVDQLREFVNLSIPDFRVVKGELVITGAMPTEPIIHDEDGMFLVFDPMGEAKNLYVTKPQIFYLTKEHLAIKNFNKEQIFDFKATDAIVYDKASLQNLVSLLNSPAALGVGVLFVVIMHILFLFVGFFIHFTIGNLINTVMGFPLKREEVMPVTAYSLTVPALFYLVFVVLYWNNSTLLFITSIITNALVIGAIRIKLKSET